MGRMVEERSFFAALGPKRISGKTNALKVGEGWNMLAI